MRSIKKVVGTITAISLSVMMAVPAFAGTWQKLGGENWQWKYVEDDGSYTTNGWQLIDGKWYHLDADGFLDVGMRKFDDNWYVLMDSGALETNRDYGFASSDENGVWTLKYPIYSMDENADENSIFMDYCRQYGIDIDKIISDLYNNTSYTYTCSYANFPKDSEGKVVPRVATEAIISAISYLSNYWGNPFYCNYNFSIDNTTGTYSITFTSTSGFTIISG